MNATLLISLLLSVTQE